MSSDSLKNINLDIQEYSIYELEIFFKLNTMKDYTVFDVEQKENELKSRIFKSKYSNDREFIEKLLHFVSKAKNLLKSNLVYSMESDGSLHNTREQEVIHKPTMNYPIEYQNSHNKEFVQGIINPIRVNEIVKCLTIDTRFRDEIHKCSCSDYMITLPTPLKRVVSMQVTDFEIPITFYTINQHYGNHFLHLKVNYRDLHVNPLDSNNNLIPNLPILTAEKTIIMPDSNYNAVDLINKVNSMLSPFDNEGRSLYPNDIFTYIEFTLDITPNGSGTALATLGPNPVVVNFVESIEMDFTVDINHHVDNIPISQKMGWLFGFTQPKYSGKPSYKAESVIDPATIRYIYLSVNDFNYNHNDTFITAFNNSVIDKHILCRIPITTTYFSILFQNNLPIEPRQYFGPVDIQKLQIRLYDDYGRIINMNGANYSLCLKFKMLYE